MGERKEKGAGRDAYPAIYDNYQIPARRRQTGYPRPRKRYGRPQGSPLHGDTIPPAQSPEDKRGSKESLCRTTVPGPKGANDIRDRPSPCLAREGISRKDVLPGVSGQRTTSPVANLCHRRSTPALAREHTCDTKAPGKRGVLPNLFRPRCGMCRIFAISARPFPPQGDGRQTGSSLTIRCKLAHKLHVHF